MPNAQWSRQPKRRVRRQRVAWYAQVQRNHVFVFLCALRVVIPRALTKSVTQLELSSFVRGRECHTGHGALGRIRAAPKKSL